MRIRHPLRAVARALLFRAPIEAQLIVTRRCNLSCGYCSEYDGFSPPIPLETLKERIDALHRLRVVNIALLGGEPLLHPAIGEVVAHARRHAEVSLTTNGFLISDSLIDRLNRAGLGNLQVSIDRLQPDPTGYVQKSLKSVAAKLRRLKALATFDVHVTLVLCEESRDEFRATLRALRALDVPVSVNLVHDERGRVAVGGREYLELWDEHHRGGRAFLSIEHGYGRRLLQGERPDWHCRAGARFLYVDEFGKVQLCSAQRGRPAKPVTEYGVDDIRAHSRSRKGCESGCAMFCVYRNSRLDNAPLGLARDVYRTLRRRIAFALVPALALLAATAAPAPAQARAESVRLTGMTLDHWSGAGPALLRPTLRLTKYSGRRPGADLALAIFPDAISFHPPALIVGLQAGLAQPVAIGPGALLVKVGGAGIVAAGVQAEGAFFHLVPGIHAGLGALIPVDRKSTLRLDVTRHVYRSAGASWALWSFGFGFAGGLRPPE